MWPATASRRRRPLPQRRDLTDLERAAREIREVGFYDRLYQDLREAMGEKNPDVGTIRAFLQKRPEFLEEYKQLNVEYNISNIHLRDIPLEEVADPECRRDAEAVNHNLALLRAIEKYTLEFEKSSFLVLLFSIEFFVLFSVQYFIVLLSLKEYQWYIYGLFLMSILVAWWYARREKEKYRREKERFERLYAETLERLQRLEERACIDRETLIIRESDEHV